MSLQLSRPFLPYQLFRPEFLTHAPPPADLSATATNSSSIYNMLYN